MTLKVMALSVSLLFSPLSILFCFEPPTSKTTSSMKSTGSDPQFGFEDDVDVLDLDTFF
jgi:hypothetical protein